MDKIQYQYSSFIRKVEPNSQMPLYEISDLFLYKDLNKETIIFEDLYFIVTTGTNYSHALCDTIGAYYQFKDIYPELKIIFLKEKFQLVKIMEYISLPLIDFANNNNYQIIDLKENNFLFKKAIIHHYGMAPVDVEKLEGTFLFDQDGTEIQKVFYRNSIKKLINNLPIDNNNPFKKIYISRKFANKNRKLLKNPHWSQETAYDPLLDEKIENLFINNGFEIVELESKGLYEQIKLFEKCKVLVGIDGTGNANGIWLNPESKIVRIKMFPTDFDWNDLLQASNKKYIYEYSFDKNNHEEVIEGIKKIIKDIQ